jgi:hypothetical protein
VHFVSLYPSTLSFHEKNVGVAATVVGADNVLVLIENWSVSTGPVVPSSK